MKPSFESSLVLAQEVRAFFRKGSHDVQNLFHVLNLWLETNREQDEGRARQLLEELRQEYAREIDRLQQSFDELLSLRTAPAIVTRIRIADVVASVVDEINTSSETSDILVEKSVDTEAFLQYSEIHVRSAVAAVVDNALRYRKPGQKLVIHLSVQATSDSVKISIQDNGIGVDTLRYRDELFAPFVRCTDQSEGQGISLHLVKTMIEQYGGEVELRSQPGEGTTVTLTLKDQS